MQSAGCAVRRIIGLDSGRASAARALARLRQVPVRGIGAGDLNAHPDPIHFFQILKEKRSPRRTRRPAARAREEKRGKPRAIQAYGPQSCRARLGFRTAAHSALEGGSGRRSKRDGPRWFSTNPPIAVLRAPSRLSFFSCRSFRWREAENQDPFHPDWISFPTSEGPRS